MSRYTIQQTVNDVSVEVAYGYDHALGYFYQQLNRETDRLLVTLDSFFDKLTGVQLAEQLCGGEVKLMTCLEDRRLRPSGVNWQHVEAMMLDLPF